MRFWRKVAIGPGCWLWLGSHNGRYGEIRLGTGRKEYAHRWIYRELFGAIPPGMVIMHRCDNPRCVRPSHLDVGTQRDNIRDAAAKGRLYRRAEPCPA
jgi:hypothetical protein